jgi:hypothetical protein
LVSGLGPQVSGLSSFVPTLRFLVVHFGSMVAILGTSVAGVPGSARRFEGLLLNPLGWRAVLIHAPIMWGRILVSPGI